MNNFTGKSELKHVHTLSTKAQRQLGQMEGKMEHLFRSPLQQRHLPKRLIFIRAILQKSFSFSFNALPLATLNLCLVSNNLDNQRLELVGNSLSSC